MGLRKEKIESIRKLLLSRREVLDREVRHATHSFIEQDPFYSDSLDQAAADTDRSFAMQLTNRDRDMLRQINEALQRIDRGEFGQCERCDEMISEARLQAFPFTTLCIDCKAELESEQHRFLVRE